MIEKDTYKTIIAPSDEVLFKDKNSKFYGLAFPISSIEQVKQHLASVKKKFQGAGHFCYAYQLGIERISYRANDDGEPNNSAGQPIYGQIQAFNLTNVLVVVVRYFGGVKLGVSGLINAYRTTAVMALDKAEIIEKTINVEYLIIFDYPSMNKVMRIIKEKKLEITRQTLEINCQIQITVRKKNAETIYNLFDNFFGVDIKILSN